MCGSLVNLILETCSTIFFFSLGSNQSAMECWAIEEHICAAEWFIITCSIIEMQRGFRRLNRHDSPSDVVIRRWFSQWHQKGSVENKSPPGRPRSVLTPQNIAWVRESVVRSSKRSAKKHYIASDRLCAVHFSQRLKLPPK